MNGLLALLVHLGDRVTMLVLHSGDELRKPRLFGAIVLERLSEALEARLELDFLCVQIFGSLFCCIALHRALVALSLRLLYLILELLVANLGLCKMIK